MVKGDKKVKKRKRTDIEDESTTGPSSSSAVAVKPSSSKATEELDADDGWVNSDTADDIKGPVMIAFVSLNRIFSIHIMGN